MSRNFYKYFPSNKYIQTVTMEIENMKKLSVWARENNISYKTAYNWFNENKLPVDAIKTESGSIFIIDENIEKNSMKELINVVKEILQEIKK